MPQNELKQVIEYEELESQMISFDKFRLLYFELKHPENRKKMAEYYRNPSLEYVTSTNT